MHQELFTIPGIDFTIYTYGPIMALGFLMAFFLMVHIAKRRGQDVEFFMDLYLWLIIFGILGAKLLYNFLDFRAFIEDPIKMMNCREGGLVWYGGVILDIGFIVWYCRRKKIGILEVTDTMAAPAALGLAIGRWGCLMAGCCYGQPLDLLPGQEAPWWSVTYPEGINMVSGLAVHPTPVYESVGSLIIALVIYMAMAKKARLGMATLLWLTLYPVLRFVVEMYRSDTIRGMVYEGPSFYISTSQFISIIVLVAAVAGWTAILKYPHPPVASTASVPAEPKEKPKAGPRKTGKGGKKPAGNNKS